ncbi:MarR family winged helix-turn-helix transcriptional regulator [Pseudonocardia sp. ICBG1293]|uniref:MarR family winged helix-turn-helix transcriptional regulator n=1 Tax=Pseudonocardia sp. ICBG1293 TaxID=2844382 RepID=UPI001CCB1D1D|nr:MarR family transcriptional regulator [Pseudonocardia sp. ICBG1293]
MPAPHPPGPIDLTPARLVPAPDPAEDPAESLADLVVRAGSAVLAERRRRTGGHGLGVTGFAVLDVLARRGRLAQRELAARVRVAPTSLTPVVDALETAGLVTRRGDRADRRVRLVGLTDAGRARWRAARPDGRGPWLREPPPGLDDAVRGYLLAVIVDLEQDRSHER